MSRRASALWSPAREALSSGHYMSARSSQTKATNKSLVEAIFDDDIGALHKAVACGENLFQRDEVNLLQLMYVLQDLWVPCNGK